MADTTLASLDSTALSLRLGELAGHERKAQVEFLLHLEEYDRRRAWAEAGYPSLWEWCLRVLHLREGAAGRRIAAMRVLRRLPKLAEALRDGRLSLSTVTLLGSVLTEENCEEIVARAAYQHLLAPRHSRLRLQEGPRPAEGAPRPQVPRRQPGRSAARGGPVRAREARQAQGGRRAVAEEEDLVAEGARSGRKAAACCPRTHPGRGPARGMETGRRAVRLARRGRPPLRKHVEAGTRPPRAGGARRAEHGRNLRLCCRTHNQLHADQAFGRAHMELFRRERPRTGEGTTARRSGGREGGHDAQRRPDAP